MPILTQPIGVTIAWQNEPSLIWQDADLPNLCPSWLDSAAAQLQHGDIQQNRMLFMFTGSWHELFQSRRFRTARQVVALECRKVKAPAGCSSMSHNPNFAGQLDALLWFRSCSVSLTQSLQLPKLSACTLAILALPVHSPYIPIEKQDCRPFLSGSLGSGSRVQDSRGHQVVWVGSSKVPGVSWQSQGSRRVCQMTQVSRDI